MSQDAIIYKLCNSFIDKHNEFKVYVYSELVGDKIFHYHERCTTNTITGTRFIKTKRISEETFESIITSYKEKP